MNDWETFYMFARMWDLLVSKAMLALFCWNIFVASTGLTFLEYKNQSELQTEKMRMQKESEQEVEEQTGAAAKGPQQDKKAKKPVRKMMKFHYGFATKNESFTRILKTKNILLGMLFTDWFEDPKLQKFNGTEWTTLYYWTLLCEVNPDRYKLAN